MKRDPIKVILGILGRAYAKLSPAEQRRALAAGDKLLAERRKLKVAK